MQWSSRRFTLVALLLLIPSADAWAQLATAQMNGRVTDPSGAVLPGVAITATQTDTGATRTVVTDDRGAYALPNLPTGPYRLEAMLSGFRTYVQTGIVLQVAGTPVINIVLALGNLEEAVTVDAAAPLVDVKSAGIGTVIENERILELPLQGRQVTDLILLAGAAVQTGQPNTRSFQGGVNIAVAGGQGFGVAYLLDGAMHNDPSTAAGLPLPFPDALQEFRLATSGLSAENGIHSGASVNAVTKSGTNRFHGNAFEFYRDKRFNATNRFAPVGPDGKRLDDGLHRNQFGGTLGGPIVQNRLFFFGGYQRTQLRQQPNANVAYVPTPAMLSGDFTAFASAACNNGRAIALRAPFVSNRVDPALFSPAAMRLVRSLPSTTDACGEIRFPFGGGENIQGQTVARVDFQRTANDSLFVRYMATTIDQDIPDFDNVLSAMNPATIGMDNLSQAVVVGNTRVFGSNTVNSLRLAYNRTRALRLNRPEIGPEDLGIRDFYNYEPHRMALNIPGGFTFGTNAGSSRALSQTYQVTDDPHARPRQPSDRVRWDACLLEHVHQELHAVRRSVRVQRPGHRPGLVGLSVGQGALDGASGRWRHRSRTALRGTVCDRRVAGHEPADPERRSPLGALLRAGDGIHRGVRHTRVELGQLPERREKPRVRQRTARASLSGRSGLSTGPLGDVRPVVEFLAARRRSLGHQRQRADRAAGVLRARLRLSDRRHANPSDVGRALWQSRACRSATGRDGRSV